MNKLNPIEHIGLAFFGRVSASISHEIKNTLSIINENAGLLEDLILFSQKGSALPVERLQRLSNVIIKQVDRADKIIKKMNRFSHSTDRSIQPVNVYETTVFVTDICDRLIALHEATLSLDPPENPVVVSSSLFHLEHIIWACIEFMLNAAEKGETIVVNFEKLTMGAQIRFACLGALKAKIPDTFPSEAEKALQKKLQADLHFRLGKREVLIILPEEIR